MGPDGWCINFDKGNRTCSIYNGELPLGHILQQFLLLTLSLYGFFFSLADRPYFCRVEPEVFQSLFGIKKKKFNKEACRFIHYLLLIC